MSDPGVMSMYAPCRPSPNLSENCPEFGQLNETRWSADGGCVLYVTVHTLLSVVNESVSTNAIPSAGLVGIWFTSGVHPPWHTLGSGLGKFV
jgi:hypothetical protein